MSKQDKQAEAWQAWTATLTPDTRRMMRAEQPPALVIESQRLQRQPPCDEEKEAFQSFRDSLTMDGRAWLDSRPEPTTDQVEEDIDVSAARYGIVECPDGEWGAMRLYKTPEALARRIGQLEGSDTVAWAFLGMPIQITRGPQRYLLLPGTDKAIQVPMYEGGPCKVVDAGLLDGLEIQEDGYLGPHELADTGIIEAKLQPQPQQGHGYGDDDDDDDDDTAGVG